MTITLTREEAQQVLDALENAVFLGQEGIALSSTGLMSAPIETLRVRLAQHETEQTGWDAPDEAFNAWWNAGYEGVMNPYRLDSQAYWAWAGWQAAKTQPEPPCKTGSQCIGGKCPQCVVDELQPVAWSQPDREHFSLWKDEWHTVPLYTALPQRERIVYCGCGDGIVPDDGAECGTCVSMRKREWRGMTDEDFDWCEEHSHGNTERTKRKAFARAIEAKLKEKNT